MQQTPFEFRTILLILFTSSCFFTFGQSIDRKLYGSSYQNIHSALRGEWVVGEVIVGDLSSGAFLLSQGFLQGDQKISTGFTAKGQSFFIRVFPNPTADFIIMEHNINPALDLQIFDLAGKHLSSHKEILSGGRIPLAGLSAGSYFFRYITEGKAVETALVVKM